MALVVLLVVVLVVLVFLVLVAAVTDKVPVLRRCVLRGCHAQVVVRGGDLGRFGGFGVLACLRRVVGFGLRVVVLSLSVVFRVGVVLGVGFLDGLVRLVRLDVLGHLGGLGLRVVFGLSVILRVRVVVLRVGFLDGLVCLVRLFVFGVLGGLGLRLGLRLGRLVCLVGLLVLGVFGRFGRLGVSRFGLGILGRFFLQVLPRSSWARGRLGILSRRKRRARSCVSGG